MLNLLDVEYLVAVHNTLFAAREGESKSLVGFLQFSQTRQDFPQTARNFSLILVLEYLRT